MRTSEASPSPGVDPAFTRLREKLGATARPILDFGRLETGFRELDATLGGGLARGGLTEVSGPPGCGATSLAMACAARVSLQGHSCAWLDPGLTFDPFSASRDGADLGRFLWLHPPGLRETFEATEVLLESEAFALLVLDLAGTADGAGRLRPAVPESVWPRLAARVREHPVALLVLSPEPLAGPLARTTLRASGGPGRALDFGAEGAAGRAEARPPPGPGSGLLRTRLLRLELVRNRGGPAGTAAAAARSAGSLGRTLTLELHVAPRKLFP